MFRVIGQSFPAAQFAGSPLRMAERAVGRCIGPVSAGGRVEGYAKDTPPFLSAQVAIHSFRHTSEMVSVFELSHSRIVVFPQKDH
jgi:hypothetical protein